MVVRMTLVTQSAQGTGFPVVMSMITPQDCTWSAWSSWTDCPAACGKDGTQTRSRTVVTPAGPGGAVRVPWKSEKNSEIFWGTGKVAIFRRRVKFCEFSDFCL